MTAAILPKWALELSTTPSEKWLREVMNNDLGSLEYPGRDRLARAMSDPLFAKLNLIPERVQPLKYLIHAYSALEWVDRAFFFKAAMGQKVIRGPVVGSVEAPDSTRKVIERAPVIYLVCSFGCIYHGFSGLQTLPLYKNSFSILQPTIAINMLKQVKLYEYLRTTHDIALRATPTDTRASLLKSVRFLKSEGSLLIRNDEMPSDAVKFVSSKMLSKPAVFPLGLLSLARISGAPLIQVGIIRNETSVDFILSQPTSIPDDSFKSLQSAAHALDSFKSTLIKRFPERYLGWAGVIENMSLADKN